MPEMYKIRHFGAAKTRWTFQCVAYYSIFFGADFSLIMIECLAKEHSSYQELG